MAKEFWYIPWTADQVSRFWAWQSQHMLDNYFTLKMGKGIVDTLCQKRSLFDALVIDYGAGPGFLTRHLLAAGAKVIAVDQSRESLDSLKTKYPEIASTVLSSQTHLIKDSSADIVVLAETIEHLSPEVRFQVLQDIRRLLKVGGLLFVTCPNSENLAQSMICCPNCAGVFHIVQHVTSFDAESLRRVLMDAGYEDVKTDATHFSPSTWLRRRKQFSARWFGRQLPHLYAVAQRRN